ncbi:hypothetical protein VNO78_19831 [Psophocarpus tetragonolobus]|uniref:Uncharacterized protein n=1 Tax=Psophocarpus tetragonolobus TaxID=3891 RepID=A0AAN9SA60_PSOTE
MPGKADCRLYWAERREMGRGGAFWEILSIIEETLSWFWRICEKPKWWGCGQKKLTQTPLTVPKWNNDHISADHICHVKSIGGGETDSKLLDNN